MSLDFFDDVQNLNVLIIGDVMIDRYLSGKVSRISPEAPVPVVNLEHSENRLGGAANVALNIKAMGANPILCSVIGNDANANLFLDLLPPNGLSSKGIFQSDERPTTIKTRIIASNQHLLRVDQEQSHDLSDLESKNFLRLVKNILEEKEVDVILFQDYNKGVLSLNIIREVILEAIKRDIPTAVDPKFKNFWAYKHVTLFKPNLREISDQIPGSLAASYDSLSDATAFINSKLGNTYTLITLSEKGLFLDSPDTTEIMGTHARTIADVCGAGDTVISIAALGLGLKMDMKEIAFLANLAGGQVCEKVGVVPVNFDQLKKEYIQIKKVGSLNGLLPSTTQNL